MKEDHRSHVVPLFVILLVLVGCGGAEGSEERQPSDASDTVTDTEVDGETAAADDPATTTTTGGSSTSTSALSITTTSTSTSTSTTSTTTASTPCSSSSITGDLGAGSTVVDGACESGWAIVDVCDAEPCGDSWVLARHQGGRWSVTTGFPTGLCRNDLSAQGVPDRVLDVVHWPPCTNAAATTSTPATTSGTVDVYSILDVFIAAWNAGDWATMSTVADPIVVETARAAAVPGGSVQPAPPRGRCFFGFPNTTCEVAYGTEETSTLYTVAVTDRLVTMESSG